MLPNDARSRGVQYTPEPVARYMVENSLGPWLRRRPDAVGDLRILDPACGPGIFLLAAFDVLLDWYGERDRRNPPTKSGEDLKAMVARTHLFGIDLDRRAVEAARAALHARASGEAAGVPDLSGNIVCGNALASDGSPSIRRIRERGGFDIVLGNPPYVFGEHLDPGETVVYAERFELARHGQPDLYKLFFERSVGDFLADGGVHAFLVPDALLARDDHADIRRWLAARVLPTAVCHVGQVFDFAPTGRVGVSAVTLISRKLGEKKLSRQSGRARCEIHRWEGDCALPGHAPPVSQCFPADGSPWTIHAPGAWYGAGGLRRALERSGDSLASILRAGPSGITRGEEIGKKALQVLRSPGVAPPGQTFVYAGEDVRRHRIAVPRRHIEADRIRKPPVYYAGPKILFVKTGAGPVAAATTDDLPALQSVYILHLRDDLPDYVTPDAVAALLCSALVTAYCYYRWTSCKGLQPQFTIGNVKSIPLPAIRDEDALLFRAMDKGVKQIRTHPDRGSPVDRTLDEAVARLYGVDLGQCEMTLAPALNALPPSQRPRWWEA